MTKRILIPVLRSMGVIQANNVMQVLRGKLALRQISVGDHIVIASKAYDFKSDHTIMDTWLGRYRIATGEYMSSINGIRNLVYEFSDNINSFPFNEKDEVIIVFEELTKELVSDIYYTVLSVVDKERIMFMDACEVI